MSLINNPIRLTIAVCGFVFISICFLSTHTMADKPLFPNAFLDSENRFEGIVVADLNGDTLPDMATANGSGDSISVFIGLGCFNFGEEQETPIEFENNNVSVQAIASGDFNNDGIADLAAAVFTSQTTNHVAILIGNGDGSYLAPQFFATGRTSYWVEVSDFNGDGNADLAVANFGCDPCNIDGDLSILIGQGDGTFTPPVNYLVGNSPYAICSEDFNNDGAIDLVVPNRDSDNVSVLIGNGDGSFLPAQSYDVGTAPRAVTVIDFDHDGIPDIAAANSDSADVSLLSGNGDGTFSSQQTVPSGSGLSAIEAGDINNDGWMDLVSAGQQTDDVNVHLGNSAGAFDEPLRMLVGRRPEAIEMVDFNSDGILDIVVADRDDRNITLLAGNGDGTVPKPIQLSPLFERPISSETADFDGDGVLDLVVSNTDSDNLTVMLGDGNGHFNLIQTVALVDRPDDIVVEDFNMDGLLDLAVVVRGSDKICVVFGIGAGLFGNPTSYDVGVLPLDLGAGDFNNDGLMDLVVCTILADQLDEDGEVQVLFGLGGGLFEEAQTILTIEENDHTFTGFCFVTTADFNNDSFDDILISSRMDIFGELQVLLGNGDGSFEPPIVFAFGSNPLRIKVADFNGDGIQDVATRNPDTITIAVGVGDGTFSNPTAVDTGPTGSITVPNIEVADFNSDGIPDLVTCSLDDNATVHLGNGDGTFNEALFYNVLADPNNVTVGDFDGDGFVDLFATHSNDEMTVLLNQSTGNSLVGDVNRDGLINLLDVTPFVDLLANGRFQFEADVNGDGTVNLLDVTPFINLLIG